MRKLFILLCTILMVIGIVGTGCGSIRPSKIEPEPIVISEISDVKKICPIFYKYGKDDLLNNVISYTLESLADLKDVEVVQNVTGVYDGEIYIHIYVTKNPKRIVSLWFMFYRGNAARGFIECEPKDVKNMCKDAVEFYKRFFLK